MKGKSFSGNEKYQAADRFLSGEYMLAHINAQAPGVDLPPHLRRSSSVTLKLSRLFRGAMELSEKNIVADLLFSGTYYTCHIPFDAIWGLTSEKGENLIWPDSTPKDVLRDLLAAEKSDRNEEQDAPEQAPPKQLPARGHLRRVK